MNNLHETVFNHPFFHGMKEEHLALLADCASDAKFAPGEFVFHESEPANKFYLIQRGTVALEAHEPRSTTAPVQKLGAGEVLGWSWLFPPFVWHFQARAIEPTEVVAFSGAHLLTLAEQNHDFGYELMKRVTQIVIHRLESTRHQLLAHQSASTCKT